PHRHAPGDDGDHRHGDALPGRAGDPRDALPLPGQVHVPRPPERVRRARLDGLLRGAGDTGVSLGERSAAVRWGMALLPLVALAVLLLAIVRLDPAGKLRGDVPPVEEIAFERVTLDKGGITVRV